MDELEKLLAPYLKEEGVDREAVFNSLTGLIAQENEKYTENLTKNKNTILEEKRAIKAEYDEYKGKYGFLDSIEGGFSQETYADMQSQIETLKASTSQNADEIAQKMNDRYEAGKEAASSTYTPQLTAYEMKVKQATEERDRYKAQYQDFQVKDKITKAIGAIGAQPDEFWLDGFKASAKPNFDDNGLTELSVRHKGNYIPIEDWINVFPTTNEGKKMIPAGFNTGGGARGSGSGASGGKLSLEEISKIEDPAARAVALDKYMESAS